MTDVKTGEKLVEENMRLVGSIAARFTGRGCDYEDLTQIGAIGLIKAARRFDESYGVKFSTYAVPVITGEIKAFLRDDGMIKISRSIKENAVKGKRCAERLAMLYGREPTISEIAKECGISREDLVQSFEASLPPEPVVKTDRDGKEIELAAPEDEEEKILNKILVSDILSSLDKNRRQIIALRYCKGLTQSETAKITGISQAQVSRIEKSVIQKLKAEYSV